jgi:hypothetical protein
LSSGRGFFGRAGIVDTRIFGLDKRSSCLLRTDLRLLHLGSAAAGLVDLKHPVLGLGQVVLAGELWPEFLALVSH